MSSIESEVTMTIEEALQIAQSNLANNRWIPLDPEVSRLVRNHYASKLVIPEKGSNQPVFNLVGTQISNGYRRVCIGDYGAYVEIDPSQIIESAIKSKWPGKPYRPVKYIWMETTDSARTKVYFQQATVKYAGYLAGMYYVSPEDIRLGE